MLTEEEGAEAIKYLQSLVGVDESDEGALEGWRMMSEENRIKTECVYLAIKKAYGVKVDPRGIRIDLNK